MSNFFITRNQRRQKVDFKDLLIDKLEGKRTTCANCGCELGIRGNTAVKIEVGDETKYLCSRCHQDTINVVSKIKEMGGDEDGREEASSKEDSN